MPEVYFNTKHLGKTLKCVKSEMNCHSMMCLGGQEEARTGQAVLGFSLGVAGDCYMACVTMELAIKCYFRALELEGTKDISLEKSLANVENKLGVFYMNQATALVQKISDNQELAVTAMAGAQDLFNYSRMYLN